jgi:hypothetical protein
MRDAMQEVGRAIQRIDDEARLALSSGNLARLFHQETPIGPGIFQLAKDRIFSLLVSLRHKIRWPLHRDLQLLNLAKVTPQPATRLASRLFHY